MSMITDPAKELAEICDALREGPHQHRPGDVHLADRLGVQAWSPEFFQSIHCIMSKSDFLVGAVKELIDDSEVQQDAIRNISTICHAFSKDSLMKSWNQRGAQFVSLGHASAIRMLSGIIRPRYAYPKLDEAEIKEVLNLMSELRAWLYQHQLDEKDFLRQILIDGIGQLEFRIRHMKWLGWGYAIESLREVVGAYYALEANVISPVQDPKSQAVLQKVKYFIQTFYEKAKFTKDVTTTADFLLRVYGAAAIGMHFNASAPALLSFSGK